MMAGNPNYWSMNDMHPLQLSNPQFVYANNNNNPSLLTSQSTDHHHRHHPATQDYPVRSWSQLLQGGGDEEEGYEGGNQVLNLNNSIVPNNFTTVDHHHHHHHHHHQAMAASISGWPPRVVPVSSSPTSCVTSLSNNFLSFSGAQENSSECNSTSTGGVPKKARVQQSSSQPPLKVRKEKLGDRITALHQLVSPFGKTDTASVLSEAIGYIRFLQTQIQVLSTPYMRNPSANSVQERNCLFPEEGVGEDLQSREAKDLRSRGLCLVPISCTDNVGDHDNGADYWAPTALGGGF